MPGTPRSVRSWSERSSRTRASVVRSSSSSCRRPTSGASARRTTSTPSRDRARSASQAWMGSLFPLAATAPASPYSMTCALARYVCSPARMPFTGAPACSRAAVLTTSPATIASPSDGRAPRLTSASPVLTAMRTWRWSPCSTLQSRIASAARTARSGSSSCAAGAPKTAITASPTNFSTVPPNPSSSLRRRAW